MIDSDYMGFEEMIRTRTRQWIEEYDESNRPRIDEGVTLTMRKRGDYFGRFYNRSRLNSQWRRFTGTGMVTYPIVGRTIRSKTATAVATKVQTEIEAVRNVPEKQAAADLARNIVRFERENHWTKQLESTVAEFCQLHRFSFIYNNYQTEGGAIVEIPETKKTETKVGDTLYNCTNCGFQFTPEDLQIPDIADDFKAADISSSEEPEPKMLTDGSNPPPVDTVTEYADGEYQPDDEGQKILEHSAGLMCPECGTNTLVLESRAKHETVDSLTGNYLSKDCGYMDVRVISPLQIRIDSYKCLGFDYKRADWFNYHPLVPAYELIAAAPHIEDKIHSGTNAWSESARWHFELNHNTSTTEGYSYRGKQYRLDELVEMNVWWIAPQACGGWRSPDNYEYKRYEMSDDGTFNEVEGKPIFTINQGETIEQSYMRQMGGKFKGMLVIMCGEEIIGFGNEHFTAKWVGIPWKIDAQSFFPQGEENLLKLQDAATNVLGMAYSHVRRRATSSLVADPLGGFSEDSVANAGQPGNIIYREPHSHEVADSDWRRYLGYLEPGEMSAAVYQFIELIIEIAKEESGVFNETVGNVENQETLGGRQMALTQSLSLMTPTQQSKALALREEEYVWLEQWQEKAPDEAYTLIKGTFEEEWKPQDIAAFKEINIRRELFVTIVEGTDTPRTQIELEQRFMAAVTMGLFLEPNPLPVNIRSHIIKSVLGIDFDIGNYNAYKRLAARRYEVIKSEVEILTPNEAFTIMPDPVTQFPVRILRPEIVASIAQDVRTAPRGTDEHLVFIEFFTDQINGLAGAKEPNEVLIFTLEKQIDTHRAFLAANTVQAMTVQGIADNAGGAVSGAANPPPVDPGAAPTQGVVQ